MLSLHLDISTVSLWWKLKSVVYLSFVSLGQRWQVAFRPNTHPTSSSQLTHTWVNIRPLCTLCVCVFCGCCNSCLPWQSCDFTRWMDPGALKPDEVIQLWMLSNWQAEAILYGLSALHALHTRLMSPVLAITSGMTNRPYHILRLQEHSCNPISPFYADMGCAIIHMLYLLSMFMFYGFMWTCQSNNRS